MTEGLIRELFEHVGLVAPSGALRLTLLSRQPRRGATAVVLVHAGRDLVLVVKRPRSPEDARGARERCELVARIRDRRSEPFRSSIPRMRACEAPNGEVWVVEAPVRGAVMKLRRSGQRRALERDILTALGWLREFQRATPAEEELDPGAARALFLRRIHSVAATFRELFELSGEARGLLEAAAGQVRAQPPPLCCRHGDFNRRNLLVNGHGLGVVDWERVGSPSCPLYDFFHFWMTYGLDLFCRSYRPSVYELCAAPPGTEAAAVFDRIYGGRDWFSRSMWSHLAWLCGDLAIDSETARALLVCYLADKSLQGYRVFVEGVRRGYPVALRPGHRLLYDAIFQRKRPAANGWPTLLARLLEGRSGR